MTSDELVAHIVKLDVPANTEVRVAPIDVPLDLADFTAESGPELWLWYNEEGAVQHVQLLP